MDTRNPSIDVIQDAQHILYGGLRRICENQNARLLAGTTPLTCTRLFPESAVTRGVAIDGLLAGNVGRDVSRWIATGTAQRDPVAACATFDGVAVVAAFNHDPNVAHVSSMTSEFEDGEGVEPGPKFDVFTYVDRMLAIDLGRDLGSAGLTERIPR